MSEEKAQLTFHEHLRAELVGAATRMTAERHGQIDSTFKSAPSPPKYRNTQGRQMIEFQLRIMFWRGRSAERTMTQFMGKASKAHLTPVPPAVGQFIIGLAHVGERPLNDHFRIDRVELRPAPIPKKGKLKAAGTITAVTNVQVPDDVSAAEIENRLRIDAWDTDFGVQIP